MSYTIEYQTACFMLPAAILGGAEDRYALAIEAGSNNLTECSRSGRERCVRDWYLGMLGTRTQVLRRTLQIAAACEGGQVHLRSSRTTPEAYYQRSKRLLSAASDRFEHHVTLSATVGEGHPLIDQAQAAGYVVYPESRWGVARVKLIPPEQTPAAWARYFELIDPHLDDGSLQPEACGQVFGLPSS